MSELPTENDVKSNYLELLTRVERSASLSRRDISDITVVGVTKRIGMERIKPAIDNGLKHLGEVISTELKTKVSEIRSYFPSAIIHVVGQMQSNKTKFAVEKCDLVQSIKSEKILELINKYAERRNKVYPVFLQVDFSGKDKLKGLSETELTKFLEFSQQFTSIEVQGLMTIAPLEFEADPKILRKYFSKTYRIFQEEFIPKIPKEEVFLSMGMSKDYEIAIEEGSNLIRVGTAIFGPRMPK